MDDGGAKRGRAVDKGKRRFSIFLIMMLSHSATRLDRRIMAGTTQPQIGGGSGGNGGKVDDGDRKRSFKVRGWMVESHASLFSLN